MEAESTRLTKRDEEWRTERLIREQEEQKQKEWQTLKIKDLADFKASLAKAERWRKSENFRLFIDEVERRGVESTEWVQWARKKADWYDPFIEANDEMLIEVDRTTLKSQRE